ncbi:centromere protein N-like [Mya arenaria]|uniref:centromere protein N-like n=1 Tax=Mya arenaria TaxID=6604 RepID=UPI0022E93B4F|nr:centromere protein N-like [Mya arenaria]
MELLAIKSIVSKIKGADIFQILDKWKFLKKSEVEDIKSLAKSERKTKLNIATDIAEFCKNKDGLTMEAVGELELICVQSFPAKKQWCVYHLTEECKKATTTDPSKFKTKLKKQIRLYFNKEYSVSVLLHHGLLWGCVQMPPPRRRRGYEPRHNLYFIHYPHSPVIIFSGLKAAHENFISQCLVVTLGFRQITEMSLSGRDYPSLAQLAMNKYMQGGFTKYVSMHMSEGPLCDLTSRKRKAVREVDDGVTDLEAGEKRRRLETLADSFGDNVQPTLERVQFRVELPYRSKRVATELQGDGELFHSKVRFQGTSVLEGIRSLAEAGYATVPLPKHLTIIPTRARNSFLLARPSRQAATTGAASSRGDIAKNGSDHMNKSRNVSKSMEPTITVNKSGNKSSEQNKERAKSGRGRKK